MSLVIFTCAVGYITSNSTIETTNAIIGIVLVAIGAGAAGCLNMWYDSDIDALMTRTCLRPIPTGKITRNYALIYGVALTVVSVILLNYFTKNKDNEIYFLMGADNLVNFHKWHKWEVISQKCNIIVFDRHGYKKKSLNSTTFKRLNKKNLKFIEFDKVNISSSQLRKI